MTPLCNACINGHTVTKIVIALLEVGADKDGNSLKLAAGKGHVGVVKALLEAGVDTETVWDGATPLASASGMGHVDVLD